MMDLLKNWLIGITATAMIAAMLECIAPDGAIKKIVKLAGGLMLVFAILMPIISIEPEKEIGSAYQFRSEGYSRALEKENINLMKTIIEEQAAAYIQDKAKAIGVSCAVSVQCRIEDGTPYPAQVSITGDLTDTQVDRLSDIIESDLAIAAENQCYERKRSHER